MLCQIFILFFSLSPHISTFGLWSPLSKSDEYFAQHLKRSSSCTSYTYPIPSILLNVFSFVTSTFRGLKRKHARERNYHSEYLSNEKKTFLVFVQSRSSWLSMTEKLRSSRNVVHDLSISMGSWHPHTRRGEMVGRSSVELALSLKDCLEWQGVCTVNGAYHDIVNFGVSRPFLFRDERSMLLPRILEVWWTGQVSSCV